MAAAAASTTDKAASPGVVSINLVAGDNIINPSEASGTVVVNGTKADAAIVTLSIGNLAAKILTGAGTTWSYTPSSAELAGLTDGAYTISATQKDTTDATSTVAHAFSVDTIAPVFTSGTATVQTGSTTAITLAATDAVTVSYALGGVDANAFSVNGSGQISFKAGATMTGDTAANGVYDLNVAATDVAGNAITKNMQVSVYYTPGQAVIDLGAYGKLIAPIQVEGKWYYYWDRSGDDTTANTGRLNSGGDYIQHDALNQIFKYDVNGVLETNANAVGTVGSTDNTYRYATLNDVKVALPTYGDLTDISNQYRTAVALHKAEYDGCKQHDCT